MQHFFIVCIGYVTRNDYLLYFTICSLKANMFYILADFLTLKKSRFSVFVFIIRSLLRPSDTDKSPDFEAKVRCASLYWSAHPTVLWSLGVSGVQ